MPYNNTRLPAQSLAESFDLPNQRYLGADQGQAPQAQGQYDPTSAEQPLQTGLAEVEGVTDKYYDTWGKLHAFTHGMWKDYGIDVTKPDFTQPGGGTPFKTYQKLSAVMMNTANSLGNRMKEQTQMRPYQATGQVTGTGEKGSPYVSTNLMPEVEDAVKQAGETFYTGGDARRAYEAHVAPVLEKLKSRPDANDPFIAHQIEVLEGLRTTFQSHPSFFNNDEAHRRAKAKAAAGATREMGIVKKLTSIKNGYWEKGSYNVIPDPDDPEKTVAFNNALSGEKAGSFTNADGKTIPLIVEGFKRTPEGQTFLVYKTSDDGTVPPPVRVDHLTGDQLASVMQNANPKMGQTDKMYGAMDILGVADEMGGLNEQALYGDDYENLNNTRSSLDTEVKGIHEVNVKKRQLGSQLDELSGILSMVGIGKKKGSIPLPDGTKLVVSKNKGSGYTVEGVGEDLSKEDIIKIAEDKGFFSNQAVQTSAQKQAADLINKYR